MAAEGDSADSSRPRRGKKFWAFVTSTALVVAIAAGVMGFLADGESFFGAVKAIFSAGVPPRITGPHNGSSVSRCVLVTGRGNPPDGHDLMVAVQSQSNGDVYVQDRVHVEGDMWSPVVATVGPVGETRNKYSLLVLSVPRDLVADFQQERTLASSLHYSEANWARRGSTSWIV